MPKNERTGPHHKAGPQHIHAGHSVPQPSELAVVYAAGSRVLDLRESAGRDLVAAGLATLAYAEMVGLTADETGEAVRVSLDSVIRTSCAALCLAAADIARTRSGGAA